MCRAISSRESTRAGFWTNRVSSRISASVRSIKSPSLDRSSRLTRSRTQWSKANAGTRGLPGVLGRDEGPCITPEDVLDSQHRFAQVERFDNVVVSSVFKADDPVDLTVLARNHDQGHIANCPHLPRQ